jgi:hypothetical protein
MRKKIESEKFFFQIFLKNEKFFKKNFENRKNLEVKKISNLLLAVHYECVEHELGGWQHYGKQQGK